MRKLEGKAIELLRSRSQRTGRLVLKGVWKVFGVDYEAEKEKQRALYAALQEKTGKGGATLKRRRKRFLKVFDAINTEINTQDERQQSINQLKELAERAHKFAMGKSGDPKVDVYQMLKWTKVETYIYQTINTIMGSYDKVDIKKRLEELKKMIQDELGKRRRQG